MAELSIGTLIKDRYRLKEFKGSGSFGEVWLAQDEVLDIEVAIKVYISLDLRGIKEFQNEYKAAYGLHHPNLLVTDYFDVWQQRPYLVMKYCQAGSVASRAGEISEPELWKFIRDVARGLAYLHGQEPDPIVHQDIKPDNILIDEHGTYLITDFGISRRIRSTMRKQSQRTATAGAVAYMGPERFSENPTPIMASDIWSLGASIYELATGYLPFDGLGGGHQLNGARRPHLSAPWSTDLSDTIRACLAQDTWDRPRAADLGEYAAAKVRGESPKAPWTLSKSADSKDRGGNDPRKTQRHNDPHGGGGYDPYVDPHGSGSGGYNPGTSGEVGEVASDKPRRHGFVNFWLWLALVGNAIAGIIYLLASITTPLDYQEVDWTFPVSTFGALMSTYGIWMLLKWRKEGFWTLALSAVVTNIAYLYGEYNFAGAFFLGLFSTTLAMGIFYGILQIRRDGVSTWQGLEKGGPLPALPLLIVMVCVSLFLFFFSGIKQAQYGAAHDAYHEAELFDRGYVEITRMEFGNEDADDNMVTDYGGTLKAKEMRYLKGKFYCTSLVSEGSKSVTFYVKVIKPDGTLKSGSSSPDGYTLACERTIWPSTNQVTLDGWGSGTSSTYEAGEYQYEVWANNHKLYGTTFNVQGTARNSRQAATPAVTPAAPANRGTTSLTVDGNSSTVNLSFSASGGSKQLTVACNGGTWSTWGIPSFCTVTNKTSTSFTLNCEANSGTSSRSDYMKIQSGDKEVRINISQSGKTQNNVATSLTVDGKTAVSTSFSANGGTETFYISTDASSWETWGIPSFCSVTNKTSTSFTLKCEANTSTSSRSDYMKIKAGGKEVRIDISQSGKANTGGKSATINRCWLEHGVTHNDNKGMKVHIDLDIRGMKGKTAEVYIWFYKEDDTTPVRNSSGKHVQYHYNLTPNYDSTNWSDYWAFLSYNWMRQEMNGVSGTYAVDVVVYDDNDNVLTRKDNNSFTATFN